MASKLSYLSKYGVNNNDDESSPNNKAKKHKKDRKKSKQPKKKQRHDDKIRDMDDISNLINGGEDEEDDEAPIVVDAMIVENGAVTYGSGGGRGFERIDEKSAGERRHDSHDSDSGGSARGGRTRRHYEDGARRRRRHDSDASSSSGTRRGDRPGRRRHDSDSEASNSNKQSGDGRADSKQNRSKYRRRRHESSDEEDRPIAKRHRHDSSDGDSKPRPRRQRHDSDSGESTPQKRRHRHDNEDRQQSNAKRRRHDSDSEDEAPKMTSGHRSGLQSSSDFATAEQRLQKKKRRELSSLTKPEGDTTYRDAAGKKRSLPMGIDKSEADLKKEEEEKSRKLNMGSYQKRREESVRAQYEQVKDMPLARRVEDTQLEESRKSIIRDGDPMAMYAYKKQRDEPLTSSRPNNNGMDGNTASVPYRKPAYKGPPPKSNRYGIRPGYRWDGIDRGNGWEDRLLGSLHSKGREKEEAYKWSSADM